MTFHGSPKKRKTKRTTSSAASELDASVFTSELAWWKARVQCRLALNTPDGFDKAASELWGDAPDYQLLGLRRGARRTLENKRALIEARLAQIDARPPQPGLVSRNIQRLKEMLDLDEGSVAVLRHIVVFQKSQRFTYALDALCDGNNGFEVSMDALAGAWEMDPALWRAALEDDAPLVRGGIVEIEKDDQVLDQMITIDPRLGRLITRNEDAIERFVRTFVDPSPRYDLASRDFPHLERFLAPLEATLRATPSGTPAHILLSGPPGTGKTQFALCLAKAVGSTPVLLRTGDEKGEVLNGKGRRAALSLTRRTLATKPGSVLIVDEAENIIDPDAMALLVGRESAPSPAKAWLNRFLEGDGTPMIWIVNSPEVFDPSILRRFTWHVPFRPPPRSVRRQILLRHLAPCSLSEAFLDELADRSDLPPYEAARLARAASFAPDTMTQESVIRLALEASDKLLGRKAPARVAHGTAFDPSLLDIGIDIDVLVARLRRRGCGRLGFFGPPGTGKSMLAAELARRIDRPLLAKDASDLLSMYVGGSEENIAEAFEEAADCGAVLFLDEADGLVSDRSKASHTWERTQVNEMLVRLEQFPGIAILATNHMKHTDPALLRRLDVKLEFGPLRKEQAWKLFLHHAPAATIAIRDRLSALELRLGDFGAALRGLEIRGDRVNANTLLLALEDEVEFRHPLPSPGRDLEPF